MKGSTFLWVLLIAMVAALIGVIVWQKWKDEQNIPHDVEENILFLCAEDKTITASFSDTDVSIALSDGYTLVLPRQASSGPGIRYASAAAVFLTNDTTASLFENEKQTHACIRAESDPGGLEKTYINTIYGFTLRYPEGYIINPQHRYEASGSRTIQGVSFAPPSSIAAGTTLGLDTYFSVEQTNSASCTASQFLNKAKSAMVKVTENETEYSLATSTGDAAGNRHEEVVYALTGTSPCVAVRYFIHSSAIENYPSGAVREFDRQALLQEFDDIRRTLILGR